MKQKFVFFTFLILCSFSFVWATSISEGGSYRTFCRLAAQNDPIFADFKNNPEYKKILEHVSYDLGGQYLQITLEKYPWLVSYFDQFRENDLVGHPQTFSYSGYGHFSPTTLRYIKTAGDLVERFGDLKNKHIVEIGGGYGGLCKILSTLGFASYTLIDLPECNELSRRYLNSLGVENVFFIDSTSDYRGQNYDLVISNYAFSEMDTHEQDRYIEKIIKNVPNGYMVVNFISHYFGIESLTIEELISILRDHKKSGVVEKEKPLTHPNNLLVTWKSERAFLSPSHESGLLYPAYEASKKGSAIKYSFSGGRFGDNLIAYFHAKWIAYKYGIPFLYSPFPFSEQFKMHDRDQCLEDFDFSEIFVINDEKQISSIPKGTLIEVPYSPECVVDYLSLPKGLPYIQVDWEDPIFHAEVVRCLTSKKYIPTIHVPKNYISLGVHVRRGGGFDNYEAARCIWPLKFPPDDYYLEQIKTISKIFPNKKIYVYIFTDDQTPRSIVDSFKSKLQNPNLIFDCRAQGNNPSSNILEDFFSMSKFDCFIGCKSNYSMMAMQLAHHFISILPMNYEVKDGAIVVNEVEIRFRKK